MYRSHRLTKNFTHSLNRNSSRWRREKEEKKEKEKKRYKILIEKKKICITLACFFRINSSPHSTNTVPQETGSQLRRKN